MIGSLIECIHYDAFKAAGQDAGPAAAESVAIIGKRKTAATPSEDQYLKMMAFKALKEEASAASKTVAARANDCMNFLKVSTSRNSEGKNVQLIRIDAADRSSTS